MDDRALITIENWMTEIVSTQSWDRLDDLHVDQISSDFKLRDNWVAAGYEAFKSARVMQTAMQWNGFRIALAIRLGENPEPEFYSFNNLQEVQKVIHQYTPPSLYLFPENSLSWENSVQKGIIQPQLSLDIPIEHCFYRQWYDTDDAVYCSTLWISAPV